VDLEIRHLRAVCTIADAGSLTKAAARLGISQPALTVQLRRIEAGLGGELFERSRHGTVPTELGTFVLHRARSVLVGMDLLSGATAAYRQQGHAETLRIGGIAASVSVGLADKVTALLPGADVHLHTEYSPRLLRDLLGAGRLDATMLVDYPGFEFTSDVSVIAIEPVFLALPAAHPLAARAEISLADVAGETVALTPPDGAGWPDVFYAACEQAGFAPRVRYQIYDGASLRALARSRDVIFPCQASFSPGTGVVVRPIAGSPVRMRHLLKWRDDGPLAAHGSVLGVLAAEVYAAQARTSAEYLNWLRRHGALWSAGWRQPRWWERLGEAYKPKL
jgi:DNA-binding transcriptional LysR family regulator